MRILSLTAIVLLAAGVLGASSRDQQIHPAAAQLAPPRTLAAQDLQFEASFNPNPVASESPTELRVTLVNQGPAIAADIYMVFVTPSGALVSLVLSHGNIGFVSGLEPLLGSVFLPVGFAVRELSLGTFSFLESGDYSFVFGATRAGTLDILGFRIALLTVLGQ